MFQYPKYPAYKALALTICSKKVSNHSQTLFACFPIFTMRRNVENYSPPAACSFLREYDRSFNKRRFCSSVMLHEKYVPENLSHRLAQGVSFDDLDASDLISVTEKFHLKGLDIQYLHKYGVKVSSDLNSLIFPLDSLGKEVAGMQFTNYKIDDVGERLELNSSPRTCRDVFFGWSLLGTNHRQIVVTSDPLDAVAINQQTDIPAISLPCDFTKFSFDVLKCLKSFSKVIFWLNPDLHNFDNHKLLGSHLGKSAFFIRPQDFPSPLSCLQCDAANMKHILVEAYPMYDESLETFDSYVNVIHDEIKQYEKNSGMKWKRFPVLNELLKGHRRGELTVFSGQTGTGKTTFMSEYSLDLCSQGLPTLWASFEISNTRLMKTMLLQYSRLPLIENMEGFRHWSEEFCKVPMIFLNFRSARTLERILHAMKNSVIVYNVQHIVIDNLQFMMNMEDYNSSLDQYRRQDQIFGAFREFATRWNCHITIVIHPKKEPEFSELNNTSISGTAKATQEADNVLILQTTKSRQYLQVTKNRFDGQKGCVLLEFDKKTQTFNVKNVSSNQKEGSQPKIL